MKVAADHPHVHATTEVLNRLDVLSDQCRVAFGLSCAERLYPLYEGLCAEESWGDPSVLRSALDNLWEFSAGKRPETKLEPGEETVLALAPRSDEHCSPLASGAQYAVSSVVHLYRYFAAKNTEEIAWCSIVSRDAITEYLDWYATPIVEAVDDATRREIIAIDWFDQPLIQFEIRKQFEDLDLLAAARIVNDATIHGLRNHGAMGIAPYDRKLVRPGAHASAT